MNLKTYKTVENRLKDQLKSANRTLQVRFQLDYRNDREYRPQSIQLDWTPVTTRWQRFKRRLVCLPGRFPSKCHYITNTNTPHTTTVTADHEETTG